MAGKTARSTGYRATGSVLPEPALNIRPEFVVCVRPKATQKTQTDANGRVAGRRVAIGAPGIREEITAADGRVTGIGGHHEAFTILRVERHLRHMTQAVTEGLPSRARIAWIFSPHRA